MTAYWMTGLVVIGLGTVAAAWWLLRPGVRPAIGRRGVYAVRPALGWIPWEEIEGAYRPVADDGDGIRLRLRVTPRLGAALTARGLAAEPLPAEIDLHMDLSGSDVSPLVFLQDLLAEAARRVAPRRLRDGLTERT